MTTETGRKACGERRARRCRLRGDAAGATHRQAVAARGRCRRHRNDVRGPEEAVSIEDEAKRKKKTKWGAKPPRRNPIAYVINYLREVISELRKVIWPNRKQMVTYTAVVLVFLAFMVTLIGLVDLGVARLVMLVFG